MPASDLSKVAQSISGLQSASQTHLTNFRAMAATQNKNITKMTKDIGTHFAKQNRGLDEVTSAMYDSSAQLQGVSGKIDSTNSILQQTLQYHQAELTALREMNGYMRQMAQNISSSSAANDNNKSGGLMDMIKGKIKDIAMSTVLRAIAPVLGVAGVGALGALGVGKLTGNFGEDRLNKAKEIGAAHPELPDINDPSRSDNDKKLKGVGEGYEASGLSKKEIADMIRESAKKRNIDPEVAVRVAMSEGMGSYQSKMKRPDGSQEQSYGPFQLFMNGGLGNEFQKKYGIHPGQDRSKESVQKQIDFSLDKASQKGWGDWHGAQRVGIKDHQGIGTAPATTEAQDQPTQAPGSGGSDDKPQQQDASKVGGDGDTMGILKKFNMKGDSAINGLKSSFSGPLAKFLAAASSAGNPISISSGYRSPPEQAQLFQAAVAKYGSPEAARHYVAPPGKSNHNKGMAADLQFSSPAAKSWAHTNAGKYGLNFRMGWEPWHIEGGGGDDGEGSPGSERQQQASSGGGMGGADSDDGLVGGMRSMSGMNNPLYQIPGMGGALGRHAGMIGGIAGLVGSALSNLGSSARAQAAPQASTPSAEPVDKPTAVPDKQVSAAPVMPVEAAPLPPPRAETAIQNLSSRQAVEKEVQPTPQVTVATPPPAASTQQTTEGKEEKDKDSTHREWADRLTDFYSFPF